MSDHGTTNVGIETTEQRTSIICHLSPEEMRKFQGLAAGERSRERLLWALCRVLPEENVMAKTYDKTVVVGMVASITKRWIEAVS